MNDKSKEPSPFLNPQPVSRVVRDVQVKLAMQQLPARLLPRRIRRVPGPKWNQSTLP